MLTLLSAAKALLFSAAILFVMNAAFVAFFYWATMGRTNDDDPHIH